MTPEQARRIVANSGLKVKPTPKPQPVVQIIPTADVADMFGISARSVRSIMSTLGVEPTKLSGSIRSYWTNEDVCVLANRLGELRSELPTDVEWITAKEAMEICKISRATLNRRAKSVRRFVNGRIMCFFDRKEIENYDH